MPENYDEIKLIEGKWHESNKSEWRKIEMSQN